MIDDGRAVGDERGSAVDAEFEVEFPEGEPSVDADPSRGVGRGTPPGVDREPFADADGGRPGDPYDVELPDGWSARCRGGTTVYENERGDARVRIVEFSKGLSLYWWVDVFVDGGDADGSGADGERWRRLEVGLGESFTDPSAAASAVESYLADASISRRSD